MTEQDNRDERDMTNDATGCLWVVMIAVIMAFALVATGCYETELGGSSVVTPAVPVSVDLPIDCAVAQNPPPECDD